MTEDPFKNKQQKQEKLAIEIKIAGPDDWEKCKKLRDEAISGEDAEMFGFVPGEEESIKESTKEKGKKEKDWRKDLSKKDSFIVLAQNDSEPIGIARASQKTEDSWHMGWVYVKDNFRSLGVGKRMIVERLNEIRKRGGSKVTVFIKNEISLHNCESLGFKKVDVESTQFPKATKEKALRLGFYILEIDLTDSEVIKKIDDVLNAR